MSDKSYKQAEAARSWRRNEELEQVLKFRTERPDEYEKLSTHLRLAAGFYEQQKAAARTEGVDTDRKETA